MICIKSLYFSGLSRLMSLFTEYMILSIQSEMTIPTYTNKDSIKGIVIRAYRITSSLPVFVFGVTSPKPAKDTKALWMGELEYTLTFFSGFGILQVVFYI